jgi:hypothetical protein
MAPSRACGYLQGMSTIVIKARSQSGPIQVDGLALDQALHQHSLFNERGVIVESILCDGRAVTLADLLRMRRERDA